MVGWSPRPGLAVAVVLCMAVGSLGLLALSTPGVGGVASAGLPGHAAPTSTAAAGPTLSRPEASSVSASGIAHALAVENALRAKGLSTEHIHFPNFGAIVADKDRQVAPMYTEAPAPMGVADIGLINRSGTLVPYSLNSTSVAGTVNITNLQALAVDGDGPDTYGIQLNSVAVGVDIFGNTSYQFWSQEYIDYTVSTEQMVFGDEVWNWTTLSGYFPASTIYAYGPNGTTAYLPELYTGVGPTFTIGYPFSLTLYLNTSLIDDRPALYFNYTLSNSTFRQSSSFDYLVFNSSVAAPSGPAPTPTYQAYGYHYDDIGFINDMEIDLLGNDNGDTTVFFAADATLSLQYWNATAGEMQEVPSAYNAGEETGETASGILVYSSGGTSPIGIVRNGPSLVGGLWNYSAGSGAVGDTVTVHPIAEYSFLFVNTGSTENASAAQWVPTATTGTTTFYLPMGGTFFLDFLMSDHDPANEMVTATAAVTLPAVHLVLDRAMGVYAPLFALDNGELAALSSSGAGTAADPYVIDAAQVQSLYPQFAQWNDWFYPVFPGLLFAGTSAWVDVTPPAFELTLPSWLSGVSNESMGLPPTNDLQIQFYDSSNVSLVRGTGISGWMVSFLLYDWPVSSVMLWDCTDMLVASNTFDVEGNALLLYGGTNNTIWDNTFVATPTATTNQSTILDSYWTTAINDTESGDLIYNNYFDVAIPAITPTVDPFYCGQYLDCYPVAYSDTWNVTDEPAADSMVVNGFTLTGSIIGTTYQGGNYWSNYGMTGNPYGVLPYNNSGAITVAGDYVPLVPFTLYPLTFQQTGLPSGLAWNVTEGTVSLSSTTAMIAVESPNGTFPLSVTAPAGYTVTAAPTSFTVSGAAAVVDITFGQLLSLTVTAKGLASGSSVSWSASINGSGTQNTTVTEPGTSLPTPSIVFEVPAGVYNVSATAVDYSVTPIAVAVTLHAPGSSIAFTFTPTPGTVNLTVTPSTASVSVDGQPVMLTDGAGSASVPAGIASIEATATGYEPYFTNVTVNASSTTTVAITLHAVVPGMLSLTVSPGSATVWVDGAKVTLTSGAYSATVAPGLYSIEATASGYYAYFNNVTVTSGAITKLPIALDVVSSSSSSSGTGGISNTGWTVIAVVAILAVIFLIGMVYYARRPPKQKGAAPAQPWQETKPSESPPPSSSPPPSAPPPSS